MPSQQIKNDDFWIGKYNKVPRKLDIDKIKELKEKAKDFLINPKVFFRHAGIFGSTGSGKTVLGKIICEEAAIHGIPIIIIDPQGDIGSLSLPGDEEVMEAHGIPGDRIKAYQERVKVNIFTPSSSKGMPISINPINLPGKSDDVEKEDIIKLLDNQSKILIKILRKVANLPSTWQSSAEAAIYTILQSFYDTNRNVESLSHLAKIIEDEDEIGIDEFLNEKQREKLAIALKTMSVGSTKLLFSGENLINMDDLTRDVEDGGITKTPINIFFLKSLYSQDEKEFFISVLVNELYSWMIRQGQAKKKPRLIFFCDEIAPFIPAGAAKPGPKEPLILLFRQARKYGIQCFIATQSPKDMDYHAYEQFNTFFIGRITSAQSLKVVQKILEAFPDDGKIQESLETIPALKSGEFLFISPDNNINFAMLFTRWLLTEHRTLTLDDVKKIIEGIYISPEKLAKLEEKRREEEERRRQEELKKQEEEAERRRQEEIKRREEEERRKREEELRKQQEEEKRRREAEEKRRREMEEKRRREMEEERKKQEEIERIRKRFANLTLKQFTDEMEKPVIEVDSLIPLDLTYRMIMHEIFARLKKISKSDFGLEFLRNLVEKRTLPNERSQMMYYLEHKTVIKAKMAKIDGDLLKFDFRTMIYEIFKNLGIKKEELDLIPVDKLEAVFFKLLHVPDLKKFLEG
ncbi:MAG: ATP-binding protein [Promethearchaeota archaeon]